MYLVSACLAGFNCRYDGGNCYNKDMFDMVSKGIAIPVCPEVMGGLTTPRKPIEVRNQDGKRHVIDKEGNIYTNQIIKGSKECLKIAQKNNIENAILKQKSPSCGCGKIYDGTFSGKLINDNGITAQMLLDNGIKVYNEKNYKHNLNIEQLNN